ncbi:hypothetical protein CDEF62S_02797 [Castellaniella defragrans]
MPARNLGADHRRRDHLALAVFEQHDRHALADVVARHVAEDARALGIQRQIDRGFLGLRITPGLRILQVLARQDHLAAQQQRLPVAVFVEDQAEGHLVLRQRRHGGRRIIHHVDFQGGRAAEDFLGLGDVLHARQLDHDAVAALLLDHGFGHAQFVDPVVQRLDVLFQGVVLHLGDGRGAQLAVEQPLVAHVVGREDHLRHRAAQRIRACVPGVFSSEGGPHRLLVAFYVVDLDLGIAQGRSCFAGHGVIAARQRAVQVHLQQEVHAPAQVQSEVHGVGAQCRQPVRRRRHEVQRHRVVGVFGVGIQRLFQLVLGLELRVGGIEAQAYGADGAVHFKGTGRGRDVALLQDLFGAHQRVLVDLHGRLGARDLDGGGFAEEIGQRVKRPDHDGGQDDEVFPDGVAIHGRSGRTDGDAARRRVRAT